MFNQHFGNYLLQKKSITPEQLRQVLAGQKSIKVRLGVLAIEAGYLNAEQVNRIHRLQSARDRKFGELAVEEGLLTAEQLESLLQTQKKSDVLLGQALIEQGIFSYEQYEAILREYKEDSGFTQEEMKVLAENDVEQVIKLFLKRINPSDSRRYREYVELFVRNLIRFIDTDIRLEEAREVDSLEVACLVTQQMEGRNTLFAGFTGSPETMARFAAIYAGEACLGLDVLARDALCEFMNVQNGLFLSNLSHSGIEMELHPSEVRENEILRAVGYTFAIPCYLSFGRIDFVCSDEIPVFTNV